MANQEDIKQRNWLRYTKLYFVISFIFLVSGVYAIFSWGLPLGLDFVGGAIVDYKIQNGEQIDSLKDKFEEIKIQIEQVQTSEDRLSIKTRTLNNDEQKLIFEIAKDLGIEQLSLQNVGPSVAPEMIKKTAIAIIMAGGGILFWVAIQFKKIIFGIAAILATAHDTTILIGSFAILGKFFDAKIDFLFVTAVLTTLSFSVHDTIVVFDRVREIQNKHGGEIENVVNRAVTETMRRSIINSLTIIIMLVSLVVFGGATIRWFATALLIGAIAGTYSSPFVAAPLYVKLSRLQKKLKKK